MADDFQLFVIEPDTQAASTDAPTESLIVRLPFGKPKPVDPERFKSTYEDILRSLTYMSDRAANLVENFAVEEITLHLGVSAEGGVAFIAKAGLTADIEIVVKRNNQTQGA